MDADARSPVRAAGVAARLGPPLVRALWLGLIPVLLAGVGLRYLVPPEADRVDTPFAAILGFMDEQPALLGALLFLGSGGLIRYWSFLLPGGRFLLPAPLDARLRLRQAFGLGVSVALVVGAALGFRAFLFEAYRVQGGSMLPTLEDGDLILARKFPYRLPSVIPARRRELPARGEMVVLEHGEGSSREHLVKRIIGVPGDRIAMRGGHPFINGWGVPSCDAGTYLYALSWGGVHGRLVVEFLGNRSYLTIYTPLTQAFADEYVVKPGEVFVLGDNRNGSTDSRAFQGGHGGGVALAAIDGEVARFLLGTHRDGTVDLGRVLTTFATELHLEGVDRAPLLDGIRRCLDKRPQTTVPPGDAIHGNGVDAGSRASMNG